MSKNEKRKMRVYGSDGKITEREVDFYNFHKDLMSAVGGYAQRIKQPPSGYLNPKGKMAPKGARFYINENGLNLRLPTNPYLPVFVGNVVMVFKEAA